MLLINCDLGERGSAHPLDTALMAHIHIANIACGGHAGNSESISFFRNLAEEKNVMVTAHLSYPDRKNFGRVRMDIRRQDLLSSLDTQMQLLPDIHAVKFHGALYNDSVSDPGLAEALAFWSLKHKISSIITPADSEMAAACTETGIRIIPEAFAERRYVMDSATERLVLAGRDKPYASIHDVATALAQAKKIAHGMVSAVLPGNG